MQCDTILRAIKELTQDNISYTSDHWQDLRLQHGRQAEYTAPQLPIVHRAAERGRGV